MGSRPDGAMSGKGEKMDKEALERVLPYALTALAAAGAGFAGGYLAGKRKAERDEENKKAVLAEAKRRRALKREARAKLEEHEVPMPGDIWHGDEWDEGPIAAIEPDGDVVLPEDDVKPDLASLASSYLETPPEEEEVPQEELEEMEEPVVTITEGFHDDAVERISQDEYLNGAPFNEKIPCTYFQAEGVLAGGDELDEMDIGDTVGAAAVQELETAPDETIFVRNHELGEDYELSMATTSLREAMDELANSYPTEED